MNNTTFKQTKGNYRRDVATTENEIYLRSKGFKITTIVKEAIQEAADKLRLEEARLKNDQKAFTAV
jgi:hypothetical protein